MNRIEEASLYYSTMFDVLENSESTQTNNLDLEMAEQYLGREIYSFVACEGTKLVVTNFCLAAM